MAVSEPNHSPRRHHRRRLLPHAPGTSQRRNHHEQELINPRRWGLLTGHQREHLNLAVDSSRTSSESPGQEMLSATFASKC
jgi:hypothetical protein